MNPVTEMRIDAETALGCAGPEATIQCETSLGESPDPAANSVEAPIEYQSSEPHSRAANLKML